MTKQLTTEAISEAFAGAVRQNRLNRCSVGDIVAEQPALAGPINDNATYSAPTVAKVLKSLGVVPIVSPTLIRNHRRGECRCPKESS